MAVRTSAPYWCRKNEVAGARWSEFELKKKIWTVPPERFKSNASHLIPLSDAASLSSIRFRISNDHLFTTPMAGQFLAKEHLDTLMSPCRVGYP